MHFASKWPPSPLENRVVEHSLDLQKEPGGITAVEMEVEERNSHQAAEQEEVRG